MKTMFMSIGAIVSVALFAACSDEASSNAPNTAGGAIEDTNPTAELDSIKAQSSSSAEALSSSTVDTPTGNLTESDRQYIQEAIRSYGLPTYVEASDMCPEEDEECLVSLYDSATVLPASTVEYGFSTKREIVYENQNITPSNNSHRICLVEKYPQENGGRKIESESPSYSVKTMLLLENEGSHFVHYLLYNEYGYNRNYKIDGLADSTVFIDHCKKKNGVMASYGSDPLALICIAKIDSSVTLDSLIAPFTEECRSFVANENTYNLTPPIFNIGCFHNSDNTKTCDTLEIKK